MNQTSPACTTGDSYYTTVAGALSAAFDNDTIMVCPGTYTESLTVMKKLNLTGSGVSTTKIDGNLFLHAAGISGIAVVGLNITGPLTVNQRDVNIMNVEVGGITYLWYNTTVEGSTLHDISHYNNKIQILNNTIFGRIYVDFEAEYSGSVENNLIDCSGKQQCIQVEDSPNLLIKNNTLTGFSQRGIEITGQGWWDNHNINITDNTITGSGSGTGIYIYDWGEPMYEFQITGNKISSVTTGADLYTITGTNRFYNNLVNATYTANTTAGTSFNWNTTKTSGTNIIGGSWIGGNYWTNPTGTGHSNTCTNTDYDGICDNAYNISSGGQDGLPLTIPGYLNPSIAIVSPQNKTYATLTVALNVTANKNMDAWWYSLNGGANTTFTPNTTFTAASELNQLQVYSNDTVGNESSAVVWFSTDVTAPVITVASPQNKTYSAKSIKINVSTDETSNVTYSLNGGSNVSLFNMSTQDYTTFTAKNGANNITVSAVDPYGNSASKTIFFTVKKSSPPSSGGGGSGGGSSGGAGGSVAANIFEGRGLITEYELVDVMSYLGHDYGLKYVFDIRASPLSALYAARGGVVMSTDVGGLLTSQISAASQGLISVSPSDVYDENVDYILENYPGGDSLIVTRGDVECDSIAATPLSELTGAPILFVEPDKVPESALEKLLSKKVTEKYSTIYLIGGEEAVSKDVENTLTGYAKAVERLGGETRYETSVAVARKVIELGGNKLPIATSGKKPVVYAATLANKYRSPIVYLETPPVFKTTFKEHTVVKGSLSVESFSTFQSISDNNKEYTMDLEVETKDIKDGWIYIQTTGFDSMAEKWTVKLNGYTLAYKIHSEPAAIGGDSSLIRFDVGRYLTTGKNTLKIEGTSFNVDDEFYIKGVTLVMVRDSDEKTELWIQEGSNWPFDEASFKTVDTGRLLNLFFESEAGEMKFNGMPVDAKTLAPVELGNGERRFALTEADVTGMVGKDNLLEGGEPELTILAVTSDGLSVPKVSEKEKNPHQSYVENFLDSEKFEQVGMVYYIDTIDMGF